MNGIDLMNNLIDELNRAKDVISQFCNDVEYADIINELENDIHNDLKRYYDYSDSFSAMLSDIVIEEEN